MQCIYDLFIPTSEGDCSQTNIPLRWSHKLTVAIKKPTKFKKEKNPLRFLSICQLKEAFICCGCLYPILQPLHRCFVFDLSSLLCICNILGDDLLSGSSHESYVPAQLPGLGLSRDIAEHTSQVRHVCLQDLGTTIHWPQYGRMICIKSSQRSLPTPSTNRIFHTSLYRDIQIPYKIITAYSSFLKDPSVGVESKYKARWMLGILRFIAISFLHRSNGRSGRRNYSNLSSSTDLV